MATPASQRVRWYLDRARVMPLGEWPHRAQQAARIAVDRVHPPDPAPPSPSDGPGWARPASAPVLVSDSDAAAAAALPGAVADARRRGDALVEGWVRYFGYPPAQLGPAPDWHLDRVAGRRWPEVHWSRVNHRELGLDPKWIWELGRHQGVTAMARAWRLTGDERFAEAAARDIASFVAQSPPGIGIHWRSGLELGIRVIAWAWAVEFLRGSSVLTDELRATILGSVRAHLNHLARYPSRFSSANNHEIGELAGRAVGGMCFPEIAGSADHAGAGVAGLADALERQVLPDGVNAEQAIGYQGFVLELGLAVVACLRRLDRTVPDGLLAPLAGIAGFLGTIASDALTLPRIGDEDEGLGIDLGPEMDDPSRLRFRLRAARALLDADLPRQEPGLDEATVWLAGAERAARAASAAAISPGSAAFPHGGYAVLRSRRDGGGEVRAVLDAGPLGLPPMNAHGHADLLSVCISVDGREVAIDPGTFTYFGDRRWRDYGRSTGAHSTLILDGRDHAISGGRFTWRSSPAAHLDAFAADGEVLTAVGHHDAYAPLRHERHLELAGRVVTVVDRLSGPPGEHRAEIRWHLAPGDVERAGDAWIWHDRRGSVELTIDGLSEQRVVRACESLPLGFSSAGLERREESPSLVGRALVTLPARVTTRIVAATG